jgi:hypothetical protein
MSAQHYTLDTYPLGRNPHTRVGRSTIAYQEAHTNALAALRTIVRKCMHTPMAGVSADDLEETLAEIVEVAIEGLPAGEDIEELSL